MIAHTNGQKERKVQTMTKEQQNQNKQEYREALGIVYKLDKGMIDWCVNDAEIVCKVAGYLLPIEKRKLEKRFCFGYSDCGQGEDYQTAIKRADLARHSEAYFKQENLRHYKSWLGHIDGHNALALVTTYGKDSVIRSLRAYAWWEVLDAVGGQAYMEALKGAVVRINGQTAYILTDEDRQIIREAYEQAMKAQEKRCDSYLKRYGLSKIHAWTYWIDD